MTYTIYREEFPALVAGHDATYLLGMIQANPGATAFLVESYINALDSTHQPGLKEVEALMPNQTMPSQYYSLSDLIDSKAAKCRHQELTCALLQITEVAVLIQKHPASAARAIPAAITRLMHLNRIRPYRIVRDMMIEYWPEYEKQIRTEWKNMPRRSAAPKCFSDSPAFRNIPLSMLSDPSKYLQNKLLDGWVLAHVEERDGTFTVNLYTQTNNGGRLLKHTARGQIMPNHDTAPAYVMSESNTGSGNLKALTKQFTADARLPDSPEAIVSNRSCWFISGNDAANTAFVEQAVKRYQAFILKTSKKLCTHPEKKPA